MAASDFGNLAAASDFGGLTSETSYGQSCSSGYVNASAVALLAFLFLLNIIQDFIEQITGNGRRKRSAEDEMDPAIQFINDGGLEAMKEGLPNIIVPLMVEMSFAPNSTCSEKPLCEVNHRLSHDYGSVGHVFAYLFTNVVSQAFSTGSQSSVGLLQDAALQGRNGGNCMKYLKCYAYSNAFT